MIRTILFYPAVVLSLFVSLLALIRIKYLELRGKTKEKIIFIHKVTRGWARFVMKMSGAEITVKGLENIPDDQTVLFMANHQSFFDIPLLMSVIDVPKGFIAKKELENWPGISTWMRYIRCIFMDRQRTAQRCYLSSHSRDAAPFNKRLWRRNRARFRADS